jgi:hypothetical protein
VFVVVLLGCDRPNPEAIVALVENSAPMSG